MSTILSSSALETLIGANGAAWLRAISPALRSSSSARSATACSTRGRPVDLRVEVEAPAAREQRAEALEELRDRREAQRHVAERDRRRAADGERAKRRRQRRRILRREPALRPAARAAPGRGGRSDRARAASRSSEPGRGLLHAAVLGEAPRELLGGLLGLELAELGRLVREERARLQLEQRGDEDEELAARLEVELVPLGQALDEGEDDRGDVDLARLELLLQEQREQEVERALERVEVERRARAPSVGSTGGG